jgi:hypothetical protein
MTDKKNTRIRYLATDFEYRKDNSGNWILCQAAFLGLNKYFENCFEQNFFFKDSMKCPEFVKKTIQLELHSESHYMSNLRSPEDCLHYLYHSLMNGKDGNIELVGHNIIDFDLPRFEKLMHDYGYPFWRNDKGFKNGINEGVFGHNIHDTRHIAEGYRALMYSNSIKTHVTLDNAVDIFGIPINKNKRHDASYDCWLAAQVFIRDKWQKLDGYVFKNYLKRAADHSDYIPVEVNTASSESLYSEVSDTDAESIY